MAWEVVELAGVILNLDKTVHVRPVGDILKHGHLDCECLPDLILVRADSGWGLQVTHHRLGEDTERAAPKDGPFSPVT